MSNREFQKFENSQFPQRFIVQMFPEVSKVSIFILKMKVLGTKLSFQNWKALPWYTRMKKNLVTWGVKIKAGVEQKMLDIMIFMKKIKMIETLKSLVPD